LNRQNFDDNKIKGSSNASTGSASDSGSGDVNK
jgi:hypothetical protein